MIGEHRPDQSGPKGCFAAEHFENHSVGNEDRNGPKESGRKPKPKIAFSENRIKEMDDVIVEGRRGQDCSVNLGKRLRGVPHRKYFVVPKAMGSQMKKTNRASEHEEGNNLERPNGLFNSGK